MRSLIPSALALICLAGTVSAAQACSIQLGRPDSCYQKHGGHTYYGPGSGTRGRIYEMGERPRYHGDGARHVYRPAPSPAPAYRYEYRHEQETWYQRYEYADDNE